MDKYDIAIEHFTSHPGEIYEAWNSLYNEPLGCLFSPLGPCCDCEFGCLTQVKKGSYTSESPELTKMILEDERIPSTGRGITVDGLHVFAEYQRLADKMLPSRQTQIS